MFTFRLRRLQGDFGPVNLDLQPDSRQPPDTTLGQAASSPRMLLLTLLAIPLFLTTAQDTFFEGDILLKNEVLSQRSLEMVLQDPNLRWPNGVVPYAFDALSKLSDSQKATVREAMNSIQEKTGCTEFVLVEEEKGGDMVLITTLGYRSLPGTG